MEGNETPSQPAAAHFPIVGVGASAGGLEALSAFFRAVPAACGVAFVVIQHLDPSHPSQLVPILQRATELPVCEAEEGARVEPGRVYVIPPTHDLTIRGGVLHLTPPTSAPGLHLPIDLFLRSLAGDRQEQAVAVILSGMGSDGTAGLRAIKERGGLVLVQEPASAGFQGMPRSALSTGLVDVVAVAEVLPEKIVGYFERAPRPAEPAEILDPAIQSGMHAIVLLLHAHTGHDFSLYKDTTLYRRIQRRMGIHQLDRIGEYVRYLRENPGEIEILFRELLIGVTRFFRDPDAWGCLQEIALPALLAARPAGATIRAWVPGCSTGEEAYSLAIVFLELLSGGGGPHRLQIFATDLDRDAIARARQAVYATSVADDVSAERLGRFFIREQGRFRVRKELRDMLVFAPQNVVMDPPFTKLDLVSCRNLLIYLKPEIQRTLLSLFHYSLNPGGILFLGSADSIGSAAELFAPIRGSAKLYRRIEVAARPGFVTFAPLVSPTSGEVPRGMASPASLEAEADRFLLRNFAPAAVLVTSAGDIVYCNGNTGRYLEPAAGKANWNVLAMARRGLLHPLGRAIAEVRRRRSAAVQARAVVETEAGERAIELTVRALDEPGPLQGTLMIVFVDASAPPPGVPPPTSAAGEAEAVDGLQRAHDECDALRREIQLMREEMQASQEDMMSTNEEFQAANEELQSTNEELTTSREEMQSMNEELQTLNAELQAKVDELSRASDDMQNLLDSTEIATVFLDEALHIRSFTAKVTKLIRLIPSDVGRPLGDITTILDYEGLVDDARQVLETLAPVQREVAASDGRWFGAKLKPYRNIESQLAGVVITFSDITAVKRLEAELRRVAARPGDPSTTASTEG
ncbi:MAG: PAS domain-containing protein [Myxococcales bacterium]|nr:PAS domain-containing protein [Myxococcales bacterium]